MRIATTSAWLDHRAPESAIRRRINTKWTGRRTIRWRRCSPSRPSRFRNLCRPSKRFGRPRVTIGSVSGRAAGRLISPSAPTRAPPSWSGGSCSRNTSWRSTALATARRRRRAWSTTVGSASFTWRCTGGTRCTSRCGTGCRCWSGACRGISRSCRRRGRRHSFKATKGFAGPRWPRPMDATAPAAWACS